MGPSGRIPKLRVKSGPGRLLGALLDDLTTPVVTTFGADVVIHHRRTAVGAGREGGNRSEIVGSSLVSSLFGDFVFRMCHSSLLFYCFILQRLSFSSTPQGRQREKTLPRASVRCFRNAGASPRRGCIPRPDGRAGPATPGRRSRRPSG